MWGFQEDVKMRLTKVGMGITIVAALVVLVGPAMAADEPLLSYSFSDLVGNFDVVDPVGQSGLFTAADDVDANGDVTRVLFGQPTGDTAVFADSGSNFPGDAAFSLELPVTGADQVNAETSGGTLTLTDIDGDSIVMGIDGDWETIQIGAWFVGTVSGVQMNLDANGIFEGADGTGFDMSGFPTSGIEGNVIAMTVPGWFVDDQGVMQGFENTNVLSIGAIVPEPFTLSFLALGSLALAARRRRRGL